MLYQNGGLSSGMISGLNRPVVLEDGTVLQMIQTDAQISQICSGGPLLNLAGEVIGLSNCSADPRSVDTAELCPAGRYHAAGRRQPDRSTDMCRAGPGWAYRCCSKKVS